MWRCKIGKPVNVLQIQKFLQTIKHIPLKTLMSEITNIFVNNWRIYTHTHTYFERIMLWKHHGEGNTIIIISLLKQG